VVTQTDLVLRDGRRLHICDALADGVDARLAVLWHHGTPNLGAPPEPLLPAAAKRGIRWVSYDRPGYGGSTPHPGRDVASAAADVASVADALGIEQFGVMGHSGGAAHALACAALLPQRVLAAVCVSGLAPYHAEGLDWFAGMAAAGAAELGAAARGRAALEEHLASAEYDPELFIPADYAALAGAWSWLLGVVEQAMEGGLGGMVDDDLASVAPVGVRSWAGASAAAGAARRPGSDGAQLARRVAGAPDPFGGAVAAPGRRTRLGPGCRRGGPGLAVGARPPGLTHETVKPSKGGVARVGACRRR
jgi:pimeloyl-ACP methyl ester carboxylesterase